MKKIAIITNMNGIGLQRDYELLANFLHFECGHRTSVFQWDVELPKDHDWQFDLVIFLEVTPLHYMKLAPIRWAFLNPEWVKPEQIKIIDKQIDRIFAKTHEAERIFKPLWGDRVQYTGFLARDQYLFEVERRPWFLHIGGNSSLRGTQAVVDAWRWKRTDKDHNIGRHLIVVSTSFPEMTEEDRPKMVTQYTTLDEDRLRSFQNQCMFHIYPSGTEGFGHAIHEAHSVGAMLITTDAPPMNEVPDMIPVPGKKVAKYNLADVYEVNALDVLHAAQTCSDVYDRGNLEFFKKERQRIRSLFLSRNEEFKKRFNDQLNFHLEPKRQMARRSPKKKESLRIAFLGNFEAPESTENMVKWALERMGHELYPIQENRATISWLYDAMELSDLFLWVHTHRYLPITDGVMDEFLEAMRDAKIPTASLHLDKFWGIPEREPRIGVQPFWRTQFVFTADGSAQEKFLERGVNHLWMKPAVSEVYAHVGVPREQWKCDVAFVGAREYHPEYPFRPQLVDFLAETYGDRFKLIQGVRGHDLNDVYASCKIAVGDCIFAGTKNYWSDRLPETCGRFGFLLHPQIEGMETPCAFYRPQDLTSLRENIECWLGSTELELVRKMATLYTLREDTWSVRLKWILQVVIESSK